MPTCCAVPALYEWTDSEMNRRRLEAILEVKHSETERFEQGYPGPWRAD